MAKITISKRPDERRDMYRINVWDLKADGVSIGRVQRELAPGGHSRGARRFEVIADFPIFRRHRLGEEETLEARKGFDTLTLIRSYLSTSEAINRHIA